MNSRRPVNSDVMLLPFDEIYGSHLNYKLVHPSIRVTCLVGIAVVFVVEFAGRFDPVLEQITFYLFLGLPLAVLSLCVFESCLVPPNGTRTSCGRYRLVTRGGVSSPLGVRNGSRYCRWSSGQPLGLTAQHNKSLDASGGAVFLNLIRPAMLE
jgi:hypothetical protein